MSRRCENCSQWSSSDKVWGVCDYASVDRSDRLACATRLSGGRDLQADLETRFNFGCVAWSSLWKVISS